ncbi:MAG: avirulence protein [Novosphingobium lindaniclasticum]|jgi:hypothetical protein|uniref:Svx/AvrXca family virulence/avirulence protein n=1 Tax=Novosphingobium lindaniclasticum TaxID=1329895 RepID=UPI00240910CA|nr:Svx/AvrXca family virulence/avirulence protein [Novosphingobium lindaniclasticum]MDF2638668.1 avirulence protein [Novosphingobium lindaniclasticum]
MKAIFPRSALAVLLSGATLAAVPAFSAPVLAQAPGKEACTAGDWKVAATDPSDAANSALPVQMESAHFALHWKPGTVEPAVAQAAAQYLEYVWTYFLDTLKFPEPHCGSAAKFKVNAYVGVGYGLTGGADELGHMGMWIDPAALKDRFGLAHELTHALQAATGRLMDSPYTGWLFESHANWMTVQLPEFRENTHCSVLLKQYPHLYYGSTRSRYCNWQFLEYLKDTYGFEAVNAIWRTAPGKQDPARLTADPFSVLQANQGWSQARLNDVFGDWALHNANWDYTNPDGSDQGAVFRRNYGSYDQTTDANIRSATVLDPIDLKRRRFAVPELWAPQRWGYNVVKLHADAGRDNVTVTFRGVVQQNSAAASMPGLADEPEMVPPPASDWRWGVVAVGADGKSRYTPLQRGAKGAATIAVLSGDTGLYLVVMATPSQMQKIRWDQPYYSIYRYPWMVQFDGAMPDRWQPGAPEGIPGGHRHPNGGGWVGPNAEVAKEAYVGPYARVISGTVADRTRIEDHAVVMDKAQVRDDAVISGLTVLRGDTVLKDKARAATSMLGLGEYDKGIVLSGTAGNIGDVEQRGASASRGVFYGFVDPETVKDVKHGAGLSAPVREVTAKPQYRWIF